MAAVSVEAYSEVIVDQFLKLIEDEMEEQDLTITELARRAHTARPYLHRVLAGQHAPSLDWCGKIAAALGIEILFKRKPVTTS